MSSFKELAAAAAVMGLGIRAPTERLIPSYDPASRHTRLAKADHITSEKPLTKRQRRRLRGKDQP